VVAEATVDGGVGRVASAVGSWGDLSCLLCVSQHRDHVLDSALAIFSSPAELRDR
jgi:hypothetical protein